tara:strand:+ start:167 stop:1009 length:843 start_codon:yes stop_codon:yes gene_type:complete
MRFSQDSIFLICGLGKMGKIHKKYLDKNGVKNYWYDPYIDGGIESLKDIKNLSINHVIIATPEVTHYDVYNSVRSVFDGKILLEKPAVLNRDELSILSNKKLMIGMVERHNPAIDCLINNVDNQKIKNIDFVRCSVSTTTNKSINIYKDVAIHDIDMLYYIRDGYDNLKSADRSFGNIDNNYHLQLSTSKSFYRFIWSGGTFFKERKIVVRQEDCTFVVSLQEQECHKYYSFQDKSIQESLWVEKSSPVENQLIYFESNDEFDNTVCARSHQLFIGVFEL